MAADSFSKNVRAVRYDGKKYQEFDDIIIEEKCFELYVNGHFEEGICCLPRDLRELAAGKLFSMGYDHVDIELFKYAVKGTTIDIRINAAPKKHESEEQIRRIKGAYTMDSESVRRINEIAVESMKTFSERSSLFFKTGGVHSCLFFGEEAEICFFEDVGRFNALDKCIGYIIINGVKANPIYMLFSGRLSRLIIEKVNRLPVRLAASFSAATSGGIDEAAKNGMVLLSFVRNGRSNIYNYPE